MWGIVIVVAVFKVRQGSFGCNLYMMRGREFVCGLDIWDDVLQRM